MARTKLEKDARVVYYAEGKPYTGPYPALVEVVHPVEKDSKGEPSDLDLRVFFGPIDGTAHLKTRVKFSTEPKKHHWSWVPDSWAWPELEKAVEAQPVK